MKNPKCQLLLICLNVILVSCTSYSIPSTPTPVSVESEIKQVLQDDACKPPCFLGIIPEQTTVEELKTIFSRYGTHLQQSDFGYSHLPDSDGEQLIPYTTFSIRDGKVRSTLIDIFASNEFVLSLYSPITVMKRFGVPSKVEFGMQFMDPAPTRGRYLLKYYYDDLDFVIQYHSFPEVSLGEQITVCPNTDEFDSAVLSLGKDPEILLGNTFNVPLEDVTAFTLESFREYMLGPAACFDLKGNAW